MEYLLQDGLIIIPVLYIIGEMIKGIERIKDKYIPLILMVFGIGFAVAIMGINVNAIIQGILLTGTTVYGNQVYKQLEKEY